MSKILFILNAYPLKKYPALLAILFFQFVRLKSSIWHFLFDSNLIESRSILTFLHDHKGEALPEKDHMRIKFAFCSSSIQMILRWNSSDFMVFNQVFIREEYSLLKTEELLRPTILDGGANIGCTTLYLKAHFPDAMVFAMEADKDNFEILQKNIELSKLANVSCVNNAIWWETGEVFLAADYRDGREWSRHVAPSGTTKVAASTIASALEGSGFKQFDILKLDIEGAEVDIFEKDLSLASGLKGTCRIAIEVHEDTNNRVVKGLEQYGFQLLERGETLFGFRNSLV
ncbi:FkbM family methyltransferase [Chryseolinea sp. T2]|uniref:FkbM family methyltransferase n=1 Tax=Chryseolinea sp. T2 TaxID=3129255 RepID=UPI003076CBF3